MFLSDSILLLLDSIPLPLLCVLAYFLLFNYFCLKMRVINVTYKKIVVDFLNISIRQETTK